MLTARQNDLLKFIAGHTSEHSYCPTYDEMAGALGINSKSGVHRLVTALEERGFIRRIPDRARAIEVLKMPDGSLTDVGQNWQTATIGRLSDENAALKQRLSRYEAV